MGKVNNFFKPVLWRLVGEDPYIVEQCSRSTRRKFTTIGYIVFFLILITAVSISFGVYELLEAEYVGLTIGVYFGFFVLLLYVFILYTLSKNVLPKKTKKGLGLFLSYSIRIGFLMMLGFVTVQPLIYETLSNTVNEELGQEISQSILNKNRELQLEYTRLVNEEKQLNSNIKESVFSDKIAKWQSEKNLKLEAFANSEYDKNFFIRKIILLNGHWYIWVISILFVCIFLVPVILKTLIRRSSNYYNLKRKIQKQLIESHYKQFVFTYNETIKQWSSKRQIAWCSRFSDAPYNTIEKETRYLKSDTEFSNWLLGESI